jgi:hypothetical protein
MKIFLSWSGEVSHEVAKILDNWLPCMLQGVETFLSSDISKGDRWTDVLAEELNVQQVVGRYRPRPPERRPEVGEGDAHLLRLAVHAGRSREHHRQQVQLGVDRHE